MVRRDHPLFASGERKKTFQKLHHLLKFCILGHGTDAWKGWSRYNDHSRFVCPPSRRNWDTCQCINAGIWIHVQIYVRYHIKDSSRCEEGWELRSENFRFDRSYPNFMETHILLFPHSVILNGFIQYPLRFYLDQQNVDRLEHAVGWYHSHPGYGCWLSGIDVSTQKLHQKFEGFFLSIEMGE